MSARTELKKLIPVGAPLLVTGLVYLAAFFYEVGYLHYFGTDSMAARVTTESLVGGLMFFISGLCGLAFIIVAAWDWLGKRHPAFFFLVCSGCIAFGVSYIFYLSGLRGLPTYFFMNIGVCFGLTMFGLFANKYRLKLGFDIVGLAWLYSAILLTLALSAVASLGGSMRAHMERSYKLFDRGGHQYVVVREYGDMIVAKEYTGKQSLTVTMPVIYVNQHTSDIVYQYVTVE